MIFVEFGFSYTYTRYREVVLLGGSYATRSCMFLCVNSVYCVANMFLHLGERVVRGCTCYTGSMLSLVGARPGYFVVLGRMCARLCFVRVKHHLFGMVCLPTMHTFLEHMPVMYVGQTECSILGGNSASAVLSVKHNSNRFYPSNNIRAGGLAKHYLARAEAFAQVVLRLLPNPRRVTVSECERKHVAPCLFVGTNLRRQTPSTHMPWTRKTTRKIPDRTQRLI